MKITKRGFPSSSILGNEGGGAFWNWRDCIPFLPFAWTTSTCRPLSLSWWFSFWVVWVENRECLTNPSPFVLELDKGSRTTAFRDIATSIFHFHFPCPQFLGHTVYAEDSYPLLHSPRIHSGFWMVHKSKWSATNVAITKPIDSSTWAHSPHINKSH